MQQRAQHVLLVTPVTPGPAGGLQGVGQAVHGKTAKITLEQFQVRHDPAWQLLGVGAEVGRDDAPVFLRTVLHVGETGVGIHRLSSCSLAGMSLSVRPGCGRTVAAQDGLMARRA
ncbi:hypothetical protein D3C81_1863770 [compost metagenome]